MSIALAIIIGLAAGALSVWVSHQFGWKVGLAMAIVFTAVVWLLATTTELSLLGTLPVLVAFSVPSIVAGALEHLGPRSRATT